MPIVAVNDVELNYRLEGDGEETIVLVNGLADDLETWAYQADDFIASGFRVLRFDNRGIGASSKPVGPYSSRMLADDAKALVDHLGITDFHLMGISMGGMIVQEYALAYPDDLRSVTIACTYAAPGPFCSRMFAMWADLAPVLGVPFVMRDVTLWAFTVPFFEQRGAELAEFETAIMAAAARRLFVVNRLNRGQERRPGQPDTCARRSRSPMGEVLRRGDPASSARPRAASARITRPTGKESAPRQPRARR